MGKYNDTKNKVGDQEYIVIGMGKFGRNLSVQLENCGCKVLAVDNDEKRINMIADYVTLSMCADVTNEESMKELGGKNFDCAIICIGHCLEATMLATLWAKEQGIKKVIAKVYDDMQKKILLKVGADEVICPEEEQGRMLAQRLVTSGLFQVTSISNHFSIVDIPVPKAWIGKDLTELKIRNKYKINVVAIKRGSDMHVSPSPQSAFEEGDVMVIIGTMTSLSKIMNLSME